MSLKIICFIVESIIMIILPIGAILNMQIAGNARTESEAKSTIRNFRKGASILLIVLLGVVIVQFLY